MTEIDDIKDLLNNQWNQENVSDIYSAPIITTMIVTSEKRRDTKENDYILVDQEEPRREEQLGHKYYYVNRESSILVTILTTKSRAHMELLANEIRRIIYANRINYGDYVKIMITSEKENSSTMVKIYEYEFNLSLKKIAVKIV